MLSNRQLLYLHAQRGHRRTPTSDLSSTPWSPRHELSPPTPARTCTARETNRGWVQRGVQVRLDLPRTGGRRSRPQRGRPLLRQRSGAWHLVRQRPRPWRRRIARSTSRRWHRELPDQLRQVEPNCEVLSCAVVKARQARRARDRGAHPARAVLDDRPSSGGSGAKRFDYEVKYTLESKRLSTPSPPPFGRASTALVRSPAASRRGGQAGLTRSYGVDRDRSCP